MSGVNPLSTEKNGLRGLKVIRHSDAFANIMPFIPEPTLFPSAPTWADDPQKAALYSHLAGTILCSVAALVAFARAPKKGAVSHGLIGAGLALAAGASFVAMSLYNNYLYKEVVRHASETGLFLLAGGALFVAIGTTLIPGFAPKRGSWLRPVIPALAFVGLALAAVSQLHAVPEGTGKILGALGGVLAAAAGGLYLFDKAAPGKNPQERVGASMGFALITLGLLVAVGAAMSRGEGVDKGTLAISVGMASFGLFSLLGVLAMEGSAADFPSAPRVSRSASVVPPPPGGFAPPPPPGAMPLPPGASGAPPAPGSRPPVPGSPQAPATRPVARPPSTPPPRKPGA